VQVRESFSLLSVLDEAPGEGTKAFQHEGDHTPDFALLQAAEEIRFDGLELPGGVELSFQVRAIAQDRPRPRSLFVTLATVDRLGAVSTRTDEIDLDLEPGRYWADHVWRDESGNGLSSVSLTFDVPADFDLESSPRLKIGLLRPRAYYPHDVEVRPSQARRILLVTMDTLRADHLGSYGRPEAPSPRIDALAAESILFESCYSTTNVTNPSHASILTSLHLKDHDVKDNFTRLSSDVPNMVSALGERGFRTAAFVSSHNFEPGVTGFDTLFDEFYPAEGRQRRAEDVNHDLLPWLTANREGDFFAWVHYYDVHGPYDAPFPFNVRFPYRGPGRNPAAGDTPPAWLDVWTDPAFASAQYLGEIAYVDHHFGLVLDHMRALGMYDGATIVVTSDHGESLGEHAIHCSHKGVHETTTRVPLVMRVPGVTPGIVRGLVSSLDVYPTLFDFLDLPVPGTIRGESLRGLMERLSDSTREHVFSESAFGKQLTVRTRDFRAILGLEDTTLAPGVDIRQGQLELFATGRDPAERRDVSRARAKLARELELTLQEFLKDGMALGAERIDDAGFDEEMEGLGYVR
jgi:arylsulfatase A-like enzyme